MVLEEKRFLGWNVLDIPTAEVVVRIFEDRELTPECKVVVTPNVDHFSRLDNEVLPSGFNDAYKAATMILCDSRIVKILSYINSDRIFNVVPGSDLTRVLLEQEWIRCEKICVIGTFAEEFRKVVTRFELSAASHYNPPMGFIDDEQEVLKCIDFIYSIKPTYVFLAVGSPRQELLAKRIKDRFVKEGDSIRYVFCVGASFDFLSGKTARAPLWMQKLSLEWLHRALSEPRRMIPRYYRNALWIVRFVLDVIFKRRR